MEPGCWLIEADGLEGGNGTGREAGNEAGGLGFS